MAAPKRPSAKAPLFTRDLKVTGSPDTQAALSNCVFLNKRDYDEFAAAAERALVGGQPSSYVTVKSDQSYKGPFVFTFEPHDNMKPGCIGCSQIQRRTAELSQNETVHVTLHAPQEANIFLSTLKFEVSHYKKSDGKGPPVDTGKLHEMVITQFERQMFTIDQDLLLEYAGTNLLLKVHSLTVVDLASIAGKKDKSEGPADVSSGILLSETEVTFAKGGDASIQLTGEAKSAATLFKPNFNFEELGIGGLDSEFSDIFRRAFASRIFPPSVVARLGIKHAKGILLYGPPGTGKTLMARQIGKMLNAKEPLIVNGPEVLNKFVGQSEENIRKLFEPAEADMAKFGDESPLHMIIFDEIDAICKERGSRKDGTGVGDTVVNQLLSKIDGVNALNNVLIIGMTNRKDLLDEALLRPGRLEVHMEISLPDEKGRLQIWRIHTASMRKAGFLDPGVSLEELAVKTKNYTGAEIEGVVKSASSFALNRHVDVHTTSVTNKDAESVRVIMEDFENALEEVRPAHGKSEDELQNALRNGIIEYGLEFVDMMTEGMSLVKQVRSSTRTPIVTCLLEGSSGCGKTTVAAQLATDSDFPYVRMITPDQLISLGELSKCGVITKVFQDSYKSPMSVIIIDDIERILEYVRIGPRFSVAILQTLIVNMRKPPPEGKKLLVIATTSCKSVLEDFDLLQVFNAVVNVPDIKTGAAVGKVLSALNVFSKGECEALAKSFDDKVRAAGSDPLREPRIPIKKLTMLAEMAKQDDSPFERFKGFLDQNLSESYVTL
jgi:vesicle-fusing ATPase